MWWGIPLCVLWIRDARLSLREEQCLAVFWVAVAEVANPSWPLSPGVPSIVSDIWTLLVGDTLWGGLGKVTLLKEVRHYGWALSGLDLSLVVAALSALCPQLLLQATCCRQLPHLPQHHRLSLWNPNNHSSVSCLDHSAYHSRWKITNILSTAKSLFWL